MADQDEFLPMPAGKMQAIRTMDLDRAGTVQFPKKPMAEMEQGLLYYVPIMSGSGSDETWGYLGKAEKIQEGKVTVWFVDAHAVVQTDRESEQKTRTFDIDNGDLGDVYLVRENAQAPAEAPDLAPTTTEEFDSALLKIKYFQRIVKENKTTGKWTFRLQVLRDAVDTVLPFINGTSAEEKKTMVTKAFNDEFTTAKDKAEAAAPLGNDKPTFIMGEVAVNITNITLIAEHVLNSRGGGSDGVAWQHADDSEPVSRACLEEMKTWMVEEMKIWVVKNVHVANASAKNNVAVPDVLVGGMTSMTGDGECAVEAAGNALDAVATGGKVSDIGKNKDAKVDKARNAIIQNIFAINEEAKEFCFAEGENEREKERNEIWKTVLGKPPAELLMQVTQKKRWVGYVATALATYHTDAEIVIIDSDNIYAKATDETVRAGVYPALLNGLPAGQAKKRRVFVVRKRNHYYFGHTSRGNTKQVIFDIGPAAEQALNLIIDHLKSENKPPLAVMSSDERNAEIARVIAMQRKAENAEEKNAKGGGKLSYSAILKRGGGRPRAASRQSSRASSPAGSRKSSRANSPNRGQAPQTARCWNFDEAGKCKFGKRCHFLHVRSKASAVSEKKQKKNVGWQKVSNRRGKSKRPEHLPALRVHSKADVHPGKWRSLLKRSHSEVHELTSWVAREGDWFVLHATSSQRAKQLATKIKQLRKAGLTVEDTASDKADEEEESEVGVCTDCLRGTKCKHANPCKK